MPTKRIILAEYFTTPDATLLFIVREDFPEPKVFEIKTSLDEIHQFVKASTALLRDSGSDVDEWQKSFGPFVDPILPWTEEGDIIWLVPHDELHYLPLHALKIEGGRRYLLERNPVCYTPSASIMKFCHAKRKGRRENALVIGDSLSDLLYAQEEALTIAKLFTATPYLQKQATKTLVKEMLEKERDQLDILHFSCHGYFDPQQPLKSGIRLAPEQSSTSDGHNEQWDLTAEEIFGLSMNADLVTLSACDTGVNERKPGDELIGLTRALIYAGTPSVLVSLWAVDDLSTSLLMQHFYQELQTASPDGKGQANKAEALQSAQIYVKNLTAHQLIDYCKQRHAEILQLEETEWSGQMAKTLQDILDLWEFSVEDPTVGQQVKPFEHPYYWSPFILVGDWK